MRYTKSLYRGQEARQDAPVEPGPNRPMKKPARLPAERALFVSYLILRWIFLCGQSYTEVHAMGQIARRFRCKLAVDKQQKARVENVQAGFEVRIQE